jgi:putative thioredoxin
VQQSTPALDDVLSPVIDVSEADFEALVIERSYRLPVVVDFWAPWCAPCHMLGPILERLAHESSGTWQLAKVNVDSAQNVAGRYGVYGIPAVKAFRDGQVVAEFVGAQPEPAVREFLTGLPPSPADLLVVEALQHESTRGLEQAEAKLRTALDLEPDNSAALLNLGRLLVGRDQHAEAVALLERVPHGSQQRPEAEAWAARARFRRDASLSGTEMEARRRLAEQSGNVEAKLELASALAARGSYREALEGLLSIVRGGDAEARERARRAMLDIFRALGPDEDLAREYQAELATALF